MKLSNDTKARIIYTALAPTERKAFASPELHVARVARVVSLFWAHIAGEDVVEVSRLVKFRCGDLGAI